MSEALLPGDIRQTDTENEAAVVDDDDHADPNQEDIGTFDPDEEDGEGVPDDAVEEEDELPVLDDEEDEPILDELEDDA